MRRAEVRERLRELIDETSPGGLLPSERLLSTDLGVSRPTVRAAIHELAAEGLVVRRHGRGTFVAQHIPADGAVPPAEGEWVSEVLEFGVEAAGPQVARKLHVSPGEDVVRTLRRRVVDGEPMALEEIRLPLTAVPGITDDHFTSGSLYDWLRTEFQVTPAEATQTTEPTVTDADESRLLEVPLYSPALQFERVTRDTTGRVIEFTRSIYRGDRYRITNHLTFGPASG